jgi:hypothetical protein
MKIALLLGLFFYSNVGYAQNTGELASPVQAGAYLPGIMGVRDYSNPGQDGLFIIDYNIFLNANTYYNKSGEKADGIEDPSGNTIPLDINISGYINSLMLVYATPKLEFLGDAQYLFIVAPNFTTANTMVGLGELTNGKTVKGGVSGFGDLAISPIMLSWALNKFDITGGYLFYAPTGRYKTGADNNVGLGYWSHILQVSTYFYPKPDKSTAFLLMPSYEIHSKIKDVDITPGSRFMLEYGISQYLSDKFEVTLQGGHAWQIGEDSGNDIYWDTSVKDQMSIFGAGIGYWLLLDKLYLNAKYSTTYSLKQHFKTNTFQLEIILIPNILKQ